MNEVGRMMIRKILIIAGLIMLLTSVIGGITIIGFSFKFAAGGWLSWWQFALAMIGYAIALAIIAIIGSLNIYLAIDTNGDNDGR